MRNSGLAALPPSPRADANGGKSANASTGPAPLRSRGRSGSAARRSASPWWNGPRVCPSNCLNLRRSAWTPRGRSRRFDGCRIGQERPPAGEADSFLDLFLLILGRNLAVYVWLLTGLVSAGATTFAVLLYNGVGLGQAIGFAAWLGLPAGAIADLLLPHGMLELGAFCIGGAVGFQGFRLALGAHRPSWESVKALRLGLVLAFGVCALALAAAVEASVTAELAASHGVRPPGEPLAGEQCGSRRT